MSIIATLFLVLIAGLTVLLCLGAVMTRRLARQAELLVPRSGQLTDVPGGRLHWIEMGPKGAKPLVMIHGLSGQLQHFTYALAGKLARDHHVIVVDRPGCGYSRRDGIAQAGLGAQARMIGDLLDQIGVGKPVLVGHSLGGAVALAMALDRPDSTAGLALLCPLAMGQSETPEPFRGLKIRSPRLRWLIGHTIAVPLAKKTADTVLEFVFSPDPPAADFLEAGGGALGLRPKAYIAASEDMVTAEPDILGQAARYRDELRVPGGILFGAEDAILSPGRHGDPMQQFGLSHETLPGRGHMIPLTAPDDCAEFVRRICARVTAAT